MEESNMSETRDTDHEGQVKRMEDCGEADGGDMTELFPVSPLKYSGDNEAEQAFLEEQLSTISLPASPKSTADNTASAEVEQEDIVSDSVLTVEEESSGSISVPNSPKSSEENTADAVSQEENVSDCVPTIVLDDDSSSASNSVPHTPKSSEENTADANVSDEGNVSDTVLTVVLEQESSGNISASSDVSKDVQNEEMEEKPSRSVSKSPEPSTESATFKAPDVDPNKVDEEEVESDTEGEVESDTEEDQTEALILSDKTLLAQTLIVKLTNLLLEKRMADVKQIQNKSDSRKRLSSAISVAGPSEASGSSAPDLPVPVPPPDAQGLTCSIMEYYISKKKEEGKGYDCSQLLSQNCGLEMELKYYTERMKSFIMLPVNPPKEPKETEESDSANVTEPTEKRARKEDETNGAENAETADLT